MRSQTNHKNIPKISFSCTNLKKKNNTIYLKILKQHTQNKHFLMEMVCIKTTTVIKVRQTLNTIPSPVIFPFIQPITFYGQFSLLYSYCIRQYALNGIAKRNMVQNILYFCTSFQRTELIKCALIIHLSIYLACL